MIEKKRFKNYLIRLGSWLLVFVVLLAIMENVPAFQAAEVEISYNCMTVVRANIHRGRCLVSAAGLAL